MAAVSASAARTAENFAFNSDLLTNSKRIAELTEATAHGRRPALIVDVGECRDKLL